MARILCLAQTAEVFHAQGGVRAVRRVARRRSGTWFDPVLVSVLLELCHDTAFSAMLAAPDVTGWEPAELRLGADQGRLDRIAEAFARVIDGKSPYTARHSERVAEIAVGLGRRLRLEPVTLRELRRAGLLHDIGKLAISNRILDKPGKLTDEEFEQVKAHPRHSQRILERAACFAALAPLAGAHHEKLDGSGYPHGLDADALDLPMRVLAVADVYEALTADRPYRGPMAPAAALEVIRRDVPDKLDARVVAALEGLVGDAPLARAA
jgi:HD-GYP domain-containing protein (c-di-GMP phosphodiesterase class II)